MFKPYQNLGSWTHEQLEDELENLHKDRIDGSLTDEMYFDFYDIIMGELLKREELEEWQEAYERAMKGI